ncbi:hypothetical protein [Vibrio alfacsensis]|uniref:hypothetical protein n=1 Tax=Vibrio alfacsensis TaxID=1074311 RepID=UPI001BEE3E76|nr:hypothetical protein [Vibrio alfacsensis]BCN24128.1 hypothetical protein VYA_13200 [Vibrio alfacsensis]
MYNREHKYVYWREERKKGKWHYIVKTFLMIFCAFFLGNVIGLIVFGGLKSVNDITQQLPTDLLIIVLVGFPLSVIGWYHEESKFFRALKRKDKKLKARLDRRKRTNKLQN